MNATIPLRRVLPLTVLRTNGERWQADALKLDAAISRSILARSGEVSRLELDLTI